MKKVIKVKASTRNGRVVKAYTKSIDSAKNVKTAFSGVLEMTQRAKDKYGEKGVFTQSNEAPVFQQIVFNKLAEDGWKITSWKNKSITAKKGTKTSTKSYKALSDKSNASAETIHGLFEPKKFAANKKKEQALKKKLTMQRKKEKEERNKKYYSKLYR